MRVLFTFNLLVATLFNHLEVQAEPLGQEIKQIVQADLDRAQAMAAKIDVIRAGRDDRNEPRSRLKTSEFLQVTRRISCEGDPRALMRSIDSDTEGSVAYVISGRCVIDRYLEVIGRDLTIAGLNSPWDSATNPEDLATLFFDQQDYKMLVASTGSSIILSGLYIESVGQSNLRLIAVRNGYLSLVEVGFKNDLQFDAAAGGGIQLYDISNLQYEQEATEAQKALVQSYRNWNLTFKIANGASAAVIGASFNAAFNLAGGAVLGQISLPTQVSLGPASDTATVSYDLTSGSSATVRNYYAPITVLHAKARSNSNIAFDGVFQPEELIVGPSSYLGPLID